MALEIKYKVVESPNSQEIWIYDTTGIYHSTNNPTGYGGINPNYNNVTTANVTVTLPDTTTLQVSIDPTSKFLLPATPLPNVIGNKLTIPQTALGLLPTQPFIDGNYRFDIVLSGTFSAVPFTVSYSTEQTFFAQLRCCSANATVDANIEDCGCAPCREKIFKTLIINLGVQGIISSNECGKPNRGLDILKTATGLCNNEDCKGCN